MSSKLQDRAMLLKTNNNPNGWQVFAPQGPSSKYEKYQDQIVVIVSVGNKKTSKYAVYLTRKVMQLLDQPKYVQVLTRGQNIGLMKSETKDNAYTVARASKKEEGSGNPFLSLHALSKAYDLASGVYDAHWENGVVVFDTRSKPSIP